MCKAFEVGFPPQRGLTAAWLLLTLNNQPFIVNLWGVGVETQMSRISKREENFVARVNNLHKKGISKKSGKHGLHLCLYAGKSGDIGYRNEESKHLLCQWYSQRCCKFRILPLLSLTKCHCNDILQICFNK